MILLQAGSLLLYIHDADPAGSDAPRQARAVSVWCWRHCTPIMQRNIWQEKSKQEEFTMAADSDVS